MPIAFSSSGRKNRKTWKAGAATVWICLLTVSSSAIVEGRSRRGSDIKSTSSPSIMDIINTEHVERILAERERNATRDRRRHLLKNDLVEVNFKDSDDSDADLVDYSPHKEHTVRKTSRKERDKNQRKDRPTRRPDFYTGDYLSNMRAVDYNLTARLLTSHDTLDPSLRKLLTGNPSKILKSSKNALLITKKEYLKKDWCKTETLIQQIREEGCQTRTIVNRFCYGQCNSFYIPKNSRRKLETSAFKSCAFCKPKKVSWITVTLICPGVQPEVRKKRVQRIKQCKCITEILN